MRSETFILPPGHGRSEAPAGQIPLFPAPHVQKPVTKTNGKRENQLQKDSFFVLKRGNRYHIISESYYYKTEPYYTIVQHEIEGRPVMPSSTAVLDACVVPICLERAKLAGIPVCEWGISQVYVPLPAVLYGLNYFATTADFFVVNDTEKAKEVIKHITNNGRYPFCYQKLGENATIHPFTVIFGRTLTGNSAIESCAEKIYALFSIPLVRMVMVNNNGNYALSSLSPSPYSHMSESERSILSAYLAHQEFL
jgi:hypothetical protein